MGCCPSAAVVAAVPPSTPSPRALGLLWLTGGKRPPGGRRFEFAFKPGFRVCCCSGSGASVATAAMAPGSEGWWG